MKQAKYLLISILIIPVMFFIGKSDWFFYLVHPEKSKIIFPQPAQSKVINHFKKAPQNKKVQLICADIETTLSEIKRFNDLKLKMFSTYEKLMKRNRQSVEVTEKVILNTEEDILDYRERYGWQKGVNYNDLLGDEKEPSYPPQSDVIALFKHLDDNDFIAIKQMVVDGKIDDTTIFNGKTVIAEMIANMDNVNVENLSLILDSGLAVDFMDLVEATQNNLSLAHHELLLKSFSGNLQKTWHHNYQDNNLLSLSVTRLNKKSFDFWLAQGVATSVSEKEISLIDVIPSPTSKEQLEVATYIFNELANLNILPKSQHSITKIESWLPIKEKVLFADYFQRAREKISNDFQFFTKNHIDDKELLKAIKVIQDLLNAYYEEQLVLAEIAKKCVSKEVVLEHGNDVQLSEHKSIKSSELPALESKVLIEKAQQLALLSSNRDWPAYLEAIDNLSNQYQTDEFKQLGIIGLIQADAPFDIIENQLLNNVSLPNTSILVIISTDNVNLGEKLLDYGLSFKPSLPIKMTLISYMNQVNASIKMRHFVAKHME
ncbi:MAG: hypothetical protein MJK12_18585 [Colwellia sp.]|nr:hypothetical protein [Colwellia sp.]